MRVLTAIPSCELSLYKGVVALTRCTSDSCPERYHRIFTGRVELRASDGQWLIDSGSDWWFGTFTSVLIARTEATDANELSTCKANVTSPILPLSVEQGQAVAASLIKQLDVNNAEIAEGGCFEQMNFCSICRLLKLEEPVYLTSDEVAASSTALLLPQHARPIQAMLRSMSGACRTSH
jgi:hypothetical protein